MAVYTNNYQTWDMPSVHGRVSQWLKGSYFTGQYPPYNDINFSPFTAVIDLETMTVMDLDSFEVFLSPNDILDLINEAASN